MGSFCDWLLRSALLRFLQSHSVVIPAESAASAFDDIIVVDGFEIVQRQTYTTRI